MLLVQGKPTNPANADGDPHKETFQPAGGRPESLPTPQYLMQAELKTILAAELHFERRSLCACIVLYSWSVISTELQHTFSSQTHYRPHNRKNYPCCGPKAMPKSGQQIYLQRKSEPAPQCFLSNWAPRSRNLISKCTRIIRCACIVVTKRSAEWLEKFGRGPAPPQLPWHMRKRGKEVVQPAGHQYNHTALKHVPWYHHPPAPKPLKCMSASCGSGSNPRDQPWPCTCCARGASLRTHSWVLARVIPPPL